MTSQHYSYKSIINDLTFTITLKLNITEGNDLVSAIGYPQAYSNTSAIKFWVADHYECYQALNRHEIIQKIITDLTERVSDHFGFNVFPYVD